MLEVRSRVDSPCGKAEGLPKVQELSGIQEGDRREEEGAEDEEDAEVE